MDCTSCGGRRLQMVGGRGKEESRRREGKCIAATRRETMAHIGLEKALNDFRETEVTFIRMELRVLDLMRGIKCKKNLKL